MTLPTPTVHKLLLVYQKKPRWQVAVLPSYPSPLLRTPYTTVPTPYLPRNRPTLLRTYLTTTTPYHTVHTPSLPTGTIPPSSVPLLREPETLPASHRHLGFLRNWIKGTASASGTVLLSIQHPPTIPQKINLCDCCLRITSFLAAIWVFF